MTERIEIERVDDGGPAFPLHLPAMIGEPDTYWNGMSIRDWFAGQALAGLISHAGYGSISTEDIANEAYIYAEAMLEARNEEVAP